MKKMFISVSGLKKSYGSNEGKTQVLNGINAEISKGEICVILGPSGSGKSTFMNIIGGLESADEGEVLIDGVKTTEFKENQMAVFRRDRFGFIFQFYNLIPDLTVEENIKVCMELTDKPLDLGEIMTTLGLKELSEKYPSQMSGGQQQRCAIARALVKNPEILLCDEPTGALDYKNSKEILQLMENINKKYNTTILMVTHNEAISQMAHHVINIKDGMIHDEKKNDSPKEVKNIEW